MNLNKTMLIGRVTKNPESKALPTGTSVCSFSLATNRTWKKDGEKKEQVEFHNVVAFGEVADTISKFVVKGQMLFVEGRNQTRTWDDKESGKKMYRTEVIVEGFQFGPKPTHTAVTLEPADDVPPAMEEGGSDEIPL